ncbi:MAG TPA: amino acid adenylation domain-containing protein [Leptolyngbyaceae cyanobacterium]
MQSVVLEGFRLSPQQKYQWLLQKEQLLHQPYRVQGAVSIEGDININVLKQALTVVVERYEILRTTFKCLPGMEIPIQVIDDRTKSTNHITWLYDDNLSNFSAGEQASKIEAIFTEISEVSFNFEQGNLVYVSLVTLSTEKYLLLISLSALIADKLTLQNLVIELNRTYTACLNHQSLDDEPLQYADIAEWQNELLNSTDTEIGREYWQKQDILNLLDLRLPLESRSPEKSEFNPKVFSLKIHSDWWEKFSDLAVENDFVANFLLTCWQILLWRLTDRSDLAIALHYTGRNYEELASAIGNLAKYLPLRFHLGDGDKFSQVLQQNQKIQAEAAKWQNSFAWEYVVPGKEKAIAFCPFSFEFELTPNSENFSNPSFSIYKQYACLDRFKVKLVCLYQEDSLNLEIHYDASLFSAEDIAQLAEQYQILLQSALSKPDACIDELEILSDRDRQKVLIEFNQTKFPTPAQCIHDLFTAQVELTPNNIAVRFTDKQLTYRELNDKANQLAHYLQKLGVGAETIVGICVERSPELLIGILGILKAGGAYLPLDPTYPPERLQFMLSDSQALFVLTQQSLVDRNILGDQKLNTTVLFLDTNWEEIDRESNANPIERATLKNLAYLIYTSGSTGKPKGTMIPHQGLVNYLNWCTQTYKVKQGCGATVQSSIGFDATITSLFSPLLVGREVVLLPEAEEIDALSSILRSQSNFSLVKITPAHLELLSQLLSGEEASGQTKAFIIGGEALLAKSVSFWRNFAPNTRLINEYGPTETVVGCCVYEVSSQTPEFGTVPIGRPIANTQLYILDRYFKPVPIGVIGELYIGGAGLARGYLNRPELTAEKFIPDPFSEKPGNRLYKTGDLARYLPDGNIEFLGRIDHQIKLRGFRIELGEIEAVLTQHPEVKQAVVLCREDEPNDKRLVAYVVLHSHFSHSEITNELRHFLQNHLPEYMIPAAFITLDSLPLTPNGKVDRQALPAPKKLQLQNFVAPRTPAEEVVAEIWQEVLKCDRVGVNHNFFELGGHSLLATQVISRLRQVFQIDLPLRSLFEAPTVESTVNLIAENWGSRDVVEEIARTLQELEQLPDSEFETVLKT